MQNDAKSKHGGAASPTSSSTIPSLRSTRRISLTECGFFNSGNTPDALMWVSEEGATSIKEKLIERFPKLHDAASFRCARWFLEQELGGAIAVGSELQAAGIIEYGTDLLSTERPCNFFAQVAAGVVVQPHMEEDQAALGPFRDRFVICRNRVENDLHWDSSDPSWVKKSSMSCRHRFLTTKNLHWQWFNALVFGLVPAELGGVTRKEALREAEDMKAAALHYAKHVGGWSDQIGLFVNVFGHNMVNCLFIHVLDMSTQGPSFQHLSNKNLSLDTVLQVLREEVAANPESEASSPSAKVADWSKLAKKVSQTGTNGATSLKAEIVERMPELQNAAQFRQVRRLLVERLGGVEALLEELSISGYINEAGELTTGTKPFNLFARCASGNMKQDGMDQEQEALGQYKDRFMICKNKPENDDHWDSEDLEWLGKASMSRRHRFLTTKNIHWQWFNALVIGMVPDSMGGVKPAEALEELEAMRAAALEYAGNIGDWSENVGLFFHVFGHNSVNSLHLHILDMDDVGPTYKKYRYKNCPIDAVLKVLREEVFSSQIPPTPSKSSAATTGFAPAARSSCERSAPRILKTEAHILELNVGGTFVTVSKDALLQSPVGSRLRCLFDENSDTQRTYDSQGRIFLDFPPDIFSTIVNRLRLLAILGSTSPAFDIPISISAELRQWIIALGVGANFPEVMPPEHADDSPDN